AGIQVANPTVLPGGSFDLPVTSAWQFDSSLLRFGVQDRGSGSLYPAQYSEGGGNVTVSAGGDIAHKTKNTAGTVITDAQSELPINWLYRRGHVGADGQFDDGRVVDPATGLTDKMSITWWVDYMNFFEGVGALGGGNVTMIAGNDVYNVDAVIPTNARMPKGTPDASKLVELGGGDLVVRAGHDLNGGAYYVERGKGTLSAGNSVLTNARRTPSTANYQTLSASQKPGPETWLPVTLFLGKSSFDVSARGDLTLGPMANVFMLPEGISNQIWYKSYFSTYAEDASVSVSSLTGSVTFRESGVLPGTTSAKNLLQAFLERVQQSRTSAGSLSWLQPWLRLNDTGIGGFSAATSMRPPILEATAFSGDINEIGNLKLAPSREGGVDLFAAGAINGLQKMGVNTVNNNSVWGAGSILVSDADPARIPSISNPRSIAGPVPDDGSGDYGTPVDWTDLIATFTESGSTVGASAVLQTQQRLHGNVPLDPNDPFSPLGPLHAGDADPVDLYALGGDISGFTLFSSKMTRVAAGRDVTDVALYLQNAREGDLSVVMAGRDLVAYNASSPLRLRATSGANELLPVSRVATAGDLQIGGPGTLEVLAGRNLDLGVGGTRSDGTGLGITSIGNNRNPSLPSEGAGLFVGAGLGLGSAPGLDRSRMDFAAFESAFLDPATGGANAQRYLPSLGAAMNLGAADNAQVWAKFQSLSPAEQGELALGIFYLALRDAGRDRLRSEGGFQNYEAGDAAIAALFPGSAWDGNISLTSREIKTVNGGDIQIFAPGGGLEVGVNLASGQAADQGILTEGGGDIRIFTRDSVDVGTSRIFTLRGGNEIIWSTQGDIAAGSSSKTVQAAPPTRVLIDSQSGTVQLDLAGLATGGGIGVLQSVPGIPPGDVDLVAPVGAVDAGDAGVRVSGNLNIAADRVLNAENIRVAGASSGAPSAAAPAEAPAVVSTSSTATRPTNTGGDASGGGNRPPDIITVEVLGFGTEGGGAGGQSDEEARRKKLGRRSPPAETAPAAGAKPPVVAER
ncbi:MAG: filamentous hemagglutinin family protein, partial [Verrucomicrobiia bacterium]